MLIAIPFEMVSYCQCHHSTVLLSTYCIYYLRIIYAHFGT